MKDFIDFRKVYIWALAGINWLLITTFAIKAATTQQPLWLLLGAGQQLIYMYLMSKEYSLRVIANEGEHHGKST